MGLRINTNIGALNASRTLNRSSQALNTSLERLSSGLRINRAKDDAAGLAIAEGLHKQVRGTAMAQRNAQDGISFVQTAEGALSESSNILQRMRELTVQALSDTQEGDGRANIQLELDQLVAQIDAIANDTEFNGINMLNDATESTTLQVGFQGGQSLDIQSVDVTAATLTINGVDVVADAGAALTAIDGAIDSVNTARATLGAQQNRLEFTINTLAIQEENAAASESAIRDADIARESAMFTRNQILVSAGTSVLAQANVLPQTALQLL